MCPAERGEADGAMDIRQSLEGAETMPLSSGWARVSSMQVFSFVTGGSCLKRPSLAHVTSREYRITLPGSAQLLSKIVDLPGMVARRAHGRSVPAALQGIDDGQARSAEHMSELQSLLRTS